MQMWSHREFATVLNTWAVDLPADALDAGRIWEIASNLVTGSPIDGLRAGVQSGEINADNVQEAIERAAMTIAANEKARQVSAELDYPCSQRFAAAIRAHADEIVEALRPHFTDAAERLTSAASLIPLEATAEDVLNRGPDATSAWHVLANAAETLRSISQVRTLLSRQYGYSHTGPEVAAFIAPVPAQEHLTRADMVFGGIGVVGQSLGATAVALADVRGGVWRHLVDAGFDLRLNTRHEAQAVAALAPTEPDPEPVAA
jgi:hypothetical protein